MATMVTAFWTTTCKNIFVGIPKTLWFGSKYWFLISLRMAINVSVQVMKLWINGSFKMMLMWIDMFLPSTGDDGIFIQEHAHESADEDAKPSHAAKPLDAEGDAGAHASAAEPDDGVGASADGAQEYDPNNPADSEQV
eukprot:gnl/TRDRNA2_/TRDRNA2_133275_c1_seq1.p3 gnl/TRDRNA2_/TRDRNA2_133275_c1~~gnl/TRDRNA2_/TRDRNA2_133275_c1_seq1.p3  ORF type:complete len:160 (+),score=24.25 gnl/TRDRNA2_/TRDRNA2_133275_c1_seq1:67-480(+)